MKALWLTLLFIVPPVFGAPTGVIVPGTNNITTSYGSGAGSQIMSGNVNVIELTCQNNNTSEIQVSYGNTTCASGDTTRMYVLPETANTHRFETPIRGAVCIKSSSGTISSGGSVYCEVVVK